ncbi:antitoxin [Nocardiopsis sp. NPDC058789]|uniref:antitoxin n=1 Tax=Nocardiopsis TaxID=2013 RepID=UPI00366C08E1
MSDTGGTFDRLKKAVNDHADKAEGVVGKVADAAKKATGGSHDDKIDKGAGAATDYLRKRAQENKRDKGQE